MQWSVRKRRRADGTVWLVDYVDREGIRRQTVVRGPDGRSTKELAEAELNRLREERYSHLVALHKRRTFKELRKAWEGELGQQVMDGEMCEETRAEYIASAASHLAPVFDSFRVDEIRRRHVKELQAKLRRTRAKASVSKDLALLSQILAIAVEDDEIAANPCAAKRKKRRKAKVQSIDSETGEELSTKQRALPSSEIQGIIGASRTIAEEAELRAASDFPDRDGESRVAIRRRYTHIHWCSDALIRVAVDTGLRRSELLGLKWSAIDLTARRLKVTCRLRNGRYGPPKSTNARRTVPLTALGADALRAWRMRSPYKAPGAPVFCASTGSVLAERNIVRYTRKRPNGKVEPARGLGLAVERAGLKDVGLHTLRHTYGSHLIAAGVDIASVSRLLGHADITVTLRVYAHPVEREADHVTGKLEAFRSAG
jgi:integrase